MIFEIKKAQSIKNLALIETESLSFNVNLMKNTKALGETRNISVRFLVNNVEKASRKDVMEIASYAVLNKCEKYPKDTTLEQINNGTVQPTTDYRYEVFLNFCGSVEKIEKILPMSIDKYSKEIQVGYFLTIKTEDFTFVIEYSPNKLYDGFLGKSNGDFYLPVVGEIIKGTAEVTGFLI